MLISYSKTIFYKYLANINQTLSNNVSPHYIANEQIKLFLNINEPDLNDNKNTINQLYSDATK